MRTRLGGLTDVALDVGKHDAGSGTGQDADGGAGEAPAGAAGRQWGVRRGLTVVEVVAVVVVLVVLVVLVGAFLQSFGKTGRGSSQVKDATQVRSIHQGMILWAQSNGGRYPVMSEIDAANTTIALPEGVDPSAKNTTANLMSFLVFNGFFSPELLVSPAESNAQIRIFDTYAYKNPAAAADPAKALWDPALTADFTAGTAHVSYAHMLPHGERLELWTHTGVATQAVLGNRGPEIAGVTHDARGRATITRAKAMSNTYFIHAGRKTWEGNIVYNDNGVRFERRLDPEDITYRTAQGDRRADVLFFDEADDRSKQNNFLGIFVKAGPAREDFRAIWD